MTGMSSAASRATDLRPRAVMTASAPSVNASNAAPRMSSSVIAPPKSIAAVTNPGGAVAHSWHGARHADHHLDTGRLGGLCLVGSSRGDLGELPALDICRDELTFDSERSCIFEPLELCPECRGLGCGLADRTNAAVDR